MIPLSVNLTKTGMVMTMRRQRTNLLDDPDLELSPRLQAEQNQQPDLFLKSTPINLNHQPIYLG
jgi:hypothetical protein